MITVEFDDGKNTHSEVGDNTPTYSGYYVRLDKGQNDDRKFERNRFASQPGEFSALLEYAYAHRAAANRDACPANRVSTPEVDRNPNAIKGLI